MSDNRHQSHDDLLDRAIATLRDTPVPQGPNPQTVFRTAAALREAAERPKPTFARRILTMTLTQRIAAAIGISIGGVVLYVIFLLFSTLGGTVAYADIAEQIREARTLQCVMLVHVSGQAEPIRIKTYFAEGGRARTEMPDGRVTIFGGGDQTKMLMLVPQTKQAYLASFDSAELEGEAGPDDILGLVDEFRGLADKQGERAGKKQIDGIEAQGFRVSEPQGREWIVWADPKAKLLLEAQTTQRVMNLEARVVLRQFVLNAPLDDGLFSLTPPAEYTVTSLDVPAPDSIEEEVVALLRGYAELRGAEFPKALDDWGALAKTMFGGAEPTEQVKDQAMKVMQHAGFLTAALGELDESDYAYTPGDAKLGDADKIVFWYKVPGEQRYRAVFGDLRVEDVTRERIATD